MADEDLIFRMEGIDNARSTTANSGNYLNADSDDEDNYFICPITDDPVSNKSASIKVDNYYSNLAKTEQYGSSSSPRNSFSFKNDTQHRSKHGSVVDHSRETWKHAIQKAKHMPDPWAEFHLEDVETEQATRYRYNAVTGDWVEDEVLIKMASQPFGRGAMRECFRTKKLSNFLYTQNWKGAYNYVAKQYIESVGRDVYFEDVRLQMEAKLWGEEYNRHKPPKQVDIVQTCIIEMKNRPGKPLFHLEHYIEGKYIKYNSNSGFVRDDNIRLTPQESAQTILRGTEEKCGSSRVRTVSGSRPPLLFRLSENSGDESMSDVAFDSLPCSPSSATPHSQKMDMLNWPVFNEVDNLVHKDYDQLDNQRDFENGGDSGYPSEKRSEQEDLDHRERGHSNNNRRHESDEDSLGSSARISVEKWNLYNSSRVHIHRPSCVAQEIQRLNALELEKKIGKSVLGKVHLAMVRYHEAGRFCEKDKEWDRESALFHLEHAADCGELEAIVGLGLMCSQLPHHILSEVTLEDTKENRNKGFDYLLRAAEAGDRPSMILVARAYDTGVNLGSDRVQDWKEALYWYNAALNMTDYDEGGEYDGTQDEPRYLLLAREAEMLMTGGFHLNKDPQRSGELYTEAAEAAMEAMKGRLANQYYQKAEEAWAMMEE
ncbi:eukaryotic elongation factor 2 kinase isoform X4 [Rissa tridactyla]|uniref:eukaryotic elongation factor 2 kinase isoform X4 n=1 Tax=Rissa tridactyla TaxID=75485 RepID=UPI0023BA7489|nr:eukaryotic elongation factor 2 kinase isoform X4 [Rissa tridactyla]